MKNEGGDERMNEGAALKREDVFIHPCTISSEGDTNFSHFC
jgi:hypothetical protein